MKDISSLSEWLRQKIEEEKDSVFKNIKLKLKDLRLKSKLKMKSLVEDSNYIIPIINGLYGDQLNESDRDVYVHFSFRYQSRDIRIEELVEFYDFEKHQGKIYLFVHGLWNDETIFHSKEKAKFQRLGTFLEKQECATVLYIRYNTGLHISQNGRLLSNLLQNFAEHYKNKIRELVIISHSMGGLVTRSACHYAEVQKQDWTKLLKKIFLLGVPNEGSYLARAAYFSQYLVRKLDPTTNRDIAKSLEIRSNGIKDLSFGYLVDEDWQDVRNGYVLNMKATKIFPLQGIDYYLIAGTMLDEKHRSKLFTFFGDGLVEKDSALSSVFTDNTLKSNSIEMKLFPKENHLTLLESNDVLEYVKSKLG